MNKIKLDQCSADNTRQSFRIFLLIMNLTAEKKATVSFLMTAACFFSYMQQNVLAGAVSSFVSCNIFFNLDVHDCSFLEAVGVITSSCKCSSKPLQE